MATSPTAQAIAVSAPNSTAAQVLATLPFDIGRSWNLGSEGDFPTRSPAALLPKRIELIDPDERFRDSIKEGFVKFTKGWHVEWNLDTNSALPTLSKRPPDAILIDIKLHMKGACSFRQLRQTMPKVPIVIITKNTGLSGLIESLAAGANGYLIKPFSAAKVVLALAQIMEGRPAVFCDRALALVLRHLRSTGASVWSQGFTTRERDLLRCLRGGMQNKEIADELRMARNTVHSQMAQLFRKLDVHNRKEAVKKYVELG